MACLPWLVRSGAIVTTHRWPVSRHPTGLIRRSPYAVWQDLRGTRESAASHPSAAAMNLLQLAFWLTRGWFRDRAELAIENLAYQQQLAACLHQARRPRIRP